ncbi:MAG: enoyl-CoA hydratase-related protein [Thermoleophilia bacterium]|nr:enoyl-CoA hydratase-related protein [Thermoleophilia bacterium]
MTATQYARRDRAAWITLDSPGNRNALSGPLVSELGDHLKAAIADPWVRVIVVTGNGPAFCAGADLKNRGDAVTSGGDGPNRFVEILKLLWDGPKPVIAAVNGHAFGGGIGLVAAADIAIGVTTAKFSFSEVRLGLIPAMISVVVLPKLGVQRGMRLFLTGERFDAARAEEYGLLHRVVAPEDLERAVQEEVEAVALGGPDAVAEVKRLVRTVARLPMDEAFAYAEERIAKLFASAEAAEGMAAFVEKRKPKWAE